ncbi:YkgJ family cysteine cluster protein [Chromobacterium violaceum]|uniref:YkgJ family cysteine cluster protein n=1 Tax=Chromobacterium violaceum TaxID=536 RepID=UPI00351A0E7F
MSTSRTACSRWRSGANGDCLYLDAQTRRCTIYERRPNTCRNHPKVGPKPNFCAYTRDSRPRLK